MQHLILLILDPFKTVYSRFAAMFPNLLAMLIIILAGIVIARITRAVLLRLLKAADFNSWSDRIGFTSLLRKGDIWARPAKAVTSFVFWVQIVLIFLAGLTALHVRLIDGMITGIAGYLPRALSAVLILVFGYIATRLVGRSLLAGLVNNGFLFARQIAWGIRFLMILLVSAMVLEQLQVAPGIVVAAFATIFGGSVLALAISFGVAGIDTARKMLAQKEEKKQEPDPARDMQHM